MQIYAGTTQPQCCEHVKSQNTPALEMVFSVTPSELIITEVGISVIFNNELLALSSLERNGEIWIARAGFTCPRGHQIFCSSCWGCGHSGCPHRCPGGCRDFNVPS